MGNGDLLPAVKVVDIPFPRGPISRLVGVVRVRSGRFGFGRVLRSFHYDRSISASFTVAVQAATTWARENAVKVYLSGSDDPTTKF